ncbi:MAG: HupE/UreJ family protein [Gammaproteobacteria bacterium]
MTLQNQLIYRILVFIFVFSCFEAEAHSRNESYSIVEITQKEELFFINIKANIRLDIFQQLKLPQNLIQESELGAYYLNSFEFIPKCRYSNNSVPTINTSAGFIRVAWELQCTSVPEQYKNQLFQDLNPSHNHLSKVTLNQEIIGDFIFNIDSNVFSLTQIPSKDNQNSTVLNFLKFGVEHILSGYDHLLFVLGLLVLFARLRLFLAITGFTIGHSISLFLSSFGIVIANMNVVESLIGFSIFILGYEYFYKNFFGVNKQYFRFWQFMPIGVLVLFWVIGMLSFLLFLGLVVFVLSNRKLILEDQALIKPLLITTFFGFIHGLGFATNLAGAGLTENLILGVLGFNIGVELGQLLFVILSLAGLGLIARFFGTQALLISKHGISSLLLSFGIYWFILRIL